MKAQLKVRLIATVFLTFLLAGCSSVTIEQYSDYEPSFVLSDFFNGELTAHGIVKDRKGQVIRYFNVVMHGQWDAEGKGELVEDFVWDDGETQQRIWRFTPNAEGQLWAHADDVKAPVPVHTSGNALFMTYQLLVPVKDKSYWITVDDRMYLTNENVLINESSMSKFGFRVGSVVLTILKR